MNANLLSAAIFTCAIFGGASAMADVTMEYASNLRYRYEYFDIDLAPGTSKASTACDRKSANSVTYVTGPQ